jgi:uncharacterized membrane protein
MDPNPCFLISNNMHKILHKLIILIAFVFIASSCNNSRGISITKRHYSKGNYVSVNKKHKTFVYREPLKKLLPGNNVQKETVPSSLESINNEKLVEANVGQNLGTSEIQNTNRTEELINEAENQKIKEAAQNERLNNSSKINKPRSLLHLNKIQPDAGARSLFWLVITILLIIWLIALISGGWGLGGLVNLLLLVALILFILWLLRLI